MKPTKAFQIQTRWFEKRTLCILLATIILFSCAKGHHQRVQDAGSSTGYSGFVVFSTTPGWEHSSMQVARLLVKGLRKKGDVIEMVFPKTAKIQSGSLLRPESSEGRLKKAWEAYYQLQLGKALSLLQSGSLRLDEDWDPAEQVLLALIYFVQGRQKEAKDILRRVRQRYPDLSIPADIYPPRFVKLFRGEGESPPVLSQDESLASIRHLILAYAKRRAWRRVWVMRIIPVGWNGRLELQRFEVGREPSRLSVVEVERGAARDTVTEKLLEKIFHQ